MKLFAAFATFIFLLAASAHAAPRTWPDTATPPLWVVEHDGKTLYLFGSVHLLPPKLKWRTAVLDSALAASDVFVFEAPLDDGLAMQRFVDASGRLPADQTLHDVLPAALYRDLQTAAVRVAYPPQFLERFRPWLAAVYLETYGYIALGFSTYYGVDRVVEREARARGAQLAYLETVEEQLSNFSALDRASEIAYLQETVRGLLQEPDLAADAVTSWASGDAAALGTLVDKGFDGLPQLRARLFAGRNRNWVPQLEAMLASGKTHFVTVGIGHLVGRESVVALLRAKGYKVTGP
jgi:uncharacterized protein